MKKYFYLWITAAFLVMPVILDAQENWVTFRNYFPVKEYEGKPFRLTAMVRVELEDDSASAGIFARVDTENGFGFIDATIWHKPFRAGQWQELSIEGNIDSGAVQIMYGAICFYNGKFHFDDFMIEVETESDHWERVLFTDFESDIPNMADEMERWKSTEFKDYDAKIMDDSRLEHSLRLFQNIPTSQLCIIPGSTHGAPWDKRELFFQILDEFFESPFSMPDTKDYYIH